MQDPRLTEIELLTLLETDELTPVDVPVSSQDVHYGVSAMAARDMIFHVIEAKLVNRSTGLVEHVYTDETLPEIVADHDLVQLWRAFLANKPVALKLNHAGKLRLWRLRDELLTNQDREQFGILWDRRAWDRALHVRLLQCSDAFPVAVLMADLDYFKNVNDTYGHLKGDSVLRSAFRLIQEITNDCAYRYGGEEIGVLLVSDEAENAADVAEQIRIAVKSTVHGETELESEQTVSLGVRLFHEPTAADKAVEQVDALLYRAKNEGRDRVASDGFS